MNFNHKDTNDTKNFSKELPISRLHAGEEIVFVKFFVPFVSLW